jgi:sugar phosphate isomerase/epimerase
MMTLTLAQMRFTQLSHLGLQLLACLLALALAAPAMIRQQPAPVPSGETSAPPAKAQPTFYAFNNSMRSKGMSTAEQVALLRKLGFDGYEGHSMDELPQLAKALDQAGLKMPTLYFKVDIDNAEQPYDPRIERYLQTFLKDRGIILTIHLHSNKFGRSDAKGDDVAVPILRKLADLAHEHGAQVAVYPHARFWAESIDDGIRLSKKVNRRNFGGCFNLCHWLYLEGDVNLGKRLDAIAPYLMSVSICGADGGPKMEKPDWKRLIQPLDQGSFDNQKLLRELQKRGYCGPIGLQTYGIAEEPSKHLKRSMEEWTRIHSELGKL